jgi:hypothetical protein
VEREAKADYFEERTNEKGRLSPSTDQLRAQDSQICFGARERRSEYRETFD